MIVTISDHFIEPEVNLNTVCLFQQTLGSTSTFILSFTVINL